MSDALHVFISYARADGHGFAVSLSAALEVAGFDPFLDQHDIVAGEPWEARLLRLLHQADTVIYVITPASVQSERCAWELDHAAELGKRVIPVMAEEVPVGQMPAALQRLNFVFFTRGQTFGEALKQLAEALRTDLDWVREHTRLTELATRWQAGGRSEEFLQRRQQLAEARIWLGGWSAGKPEATELQRAYIQASEDAERLRESIERRQIEEMRAAQEARARALKSAGRATLAAFITASLLIAAALAGGYFTYRQYTQIKMLEDEVYLLQAENETIRASLELRADDLTLLEGGLPEGEAPPPPPARGPASTAPEIEDARESPGAPVETPWDMEEAAPPPAPTRPDVSAARWNVDVFWCAGPAEAINKGRASQTVAHLQSQKAATGAPLVLGQVRSRLLAEDTNARPGYRINQDVIRAEDSERAEGEALLAMIGQGGVSGVSLGRSATPTERYLSVFFCGG